MVCVAAEICPIREISYCLRPIRIGGALPAGAEIVACVVLDKLVCRNVALPTARIVRASGALDVALTLRCSEGPVPEIIAAETLDAVFKAEYLEAEIIAMSSAGIDAHEKGLVECDGHAYSVQGPSS